MERRWIVLGLLFFGVVVSYMDRGNLSIAAVPIMKEFGLTPAQMGLLLSSFFWTYATFQVPGGALLDKFGIRKLYAGAFLVWCLASAAIGWARTFEEVLALRLVLGMGEAIAPLASMSFIKQNFDEREQGLPTAIYVAGLTMGPALGALIGSSLIEWLGWRAMFIVTGLGGCLWVIPWWLLAPAGGKAATSQIEGSLLDFLKAPVAWGLSLSVFFYSYFWYFVLTWVPAYLMQAHDFPNLKMGVTMAIPLGGMALVNLAGGAWADRVLKGAAEPLALRRRFVCVGFSLASLLMGLVWVERGGPVIWVLLASLMGVGIGAGNYWAMSQAAVPRTLVGRALGFQNMVAQLAGALAPLATGYLLGDGQDYTVAILVAGACPLVAVAALILFVRSGRRTDPISADTP
jgi:ACS family D-galactonate transporter-like MFS transporter